MKNRRSFFALLWLLLFFFPGFEGNFLLAEPTARPPAKVIKSGCEIDYPPFCIVTQPGKAQGFSVELLNATLDIMGYRAEYKTGPWAEIKAALEAGELEALPLVGRTPERDEKLDFSVPYLTLHGAIIVRKDREDIATVHDLKGLEVAVMANDNAEEFIDRNDLGLKKIVYPTFAEALKQLNNGRHDAVITQKLVAQGLIRKLALTGLKILKHPVAGFHQDYCFAVPEGHKDTLALLNEGLAKVIGNGTYEVLHAKWFADLELDDSPKIYVGADLHYPPFEFIDENGNLSGFNYDLVQAIASATGLEVAFRPDHWPDTMRKLENGKIDMIQGMFFSPERSRRFSFSAPTIVSHCVAVVKKGKLVPPQELAELRELRLVVEEKDIMHDYVLKHGLVSKTLVVKNPEEALRKVLVEKADCALVSRAVASYLIKKNNWQTLEIGAEPLLSPRYCFATRQNRKGLLAKLNEGLKIIEQSGQYHQIVERWFGIENNPARNIAKLIRYVLIVTGPMLLGLFIFFFWSWSLKLQVKKKTEDLRRSEEQYRSLIEGAPFGIFVQIDGCFSYLNRVMQEIFGVASEHEILGKEVIDCFALEHQHEVSRRIFALNYERKPQPPMRNYALRHDGKKIPVEISAVPAHFAGKDGALVFVRDISHQLQLEEQLMQSSKMEAVGHLAGGVAHDYNNMLSVILGYTELAMAQIPEDGPINKNLQEIYAAGKRSADITAQLLAFARKQVISPKVLNLNLSVESTLKMLGRLIGEDIALVWKPCDEIRLTKIDPVQLDQILANLCVNARDAISGPGEIVISTANVDVNEPDETTDIPPGEYVCLAVSDNGCGMTAMIREKIFEPFFTTKELGRGTGLGLATVYGIIKQNNGYVEVASKPREGTLFKIYFPAVKDTEMPVKSEASGELPLGDGQVVLLVEDEEAILKLTKRVIESLNYRVIAANLPSKALQIAADKEQIIDLLVTDVIMPEMDGKKLYDEILQHRPQLNALFISGYSSEYMNKNGILDDQVHFLEKPFSIKNLAEKIRELIGDKVQDKKND